MAEKEGCVDRSYDSQGVEVVSEEFEFAAKAFFVCLGLVQFSHLREIHFNLSCCPTIGRYLWFVFNIIVEIVLVLMAFGGYKICINHGLA